MLIKPNSRGFTLIEVLVAVLVLAIGLLGMASLTLNSMKSNQSAYQRTQASLLAYDMVERLRLNPSLASSYNNVSISPTSNLGSAPDGCASGCTAAQSKALNLYEWGTALQRESLTGSIALTGTNLYTVTVSWDSSFTATDGGCGAAVCSFALEANL